jgi:hypothetical protein
VHNKDNKKYTVDNPDALKALKGHEGQHVAIIVTREIFTACRLNFRNNNESRRRRGSDPPKKPL